MMKTYVLILSLSLLPGAAQAQSSQAGEQESPAPIPNNPFAVEPEAPKPTLQELARQSGVDAAEATRAAAEATVASLEAAKRAAALKAVADRMDAIAGSPDEPRVSRENEIVFLPPEQLQAQLDLAKFELEQAEIELAEATSKLAIAEAELEQVRLEQD